MTTTDHDDSLGPLSIIEIGTAEMGKGMVSKVSIVERECPTHGIERTISLELLTAPRIHIGILTGYTNIIALIQVLLNTVDAFVALQSGEIEPKDEVKHADA